MVYRNRVAIAVWGFSAVWLGMLALMTRVLLRDGAPPVSSPGLIAAVFALFWLVGIALAAFALRQPCVTVELFDDGGLAVAQRFPLKRLARRFAASQRPRAHLIESTDGDGDPYFVCELAVAEPFRPPVRVAEGPREACEAACRRINDARR